MNKHHAVVWIDHHEAHILVFDKEHMDKELIKSRAHHHHQGKSIDLNTYFELVSNGLADVQQILLTGPSSARIEFQEWCKLHSSVVCQNIVDSIKCDHPSDGQIVALARKYFQKFDLFH
jgi:hypothetical protein